MKQAKVKLPFGVEQDFLNSLQSMPREELTALVVRLQMHAQENDAFKESPEFIAAQEEFDYAKERYNLLAVPIRDTAKALKNKTRAVIEVLKSKGG